jgi:hypothetical protein
MTSAAHVVLATQRAAGGGGSQGRGEGRIVCGCLRAGRVIDTCQFRVRVFWGGGCPCLLLWKVPHFVPASRSLKHGGKRAAEECTCRVGVGWVDTGGAGGGGEGHGRGFLPCTIGLKDVGGAGSPIHGHGLA